MKFSGISFFMLLPLFDLVQSTSKVELPTRPTVDPSIVKLIRERSRFSPEFVSNSTDVTKSRILNLLDIWEPKGCITLNELYMAEYAFRNNPKSHPASKLMLEAGSFVPMFLGYTEHLAEIPNLMSYVDYNFPRVDYDKNNCLNKDELNDLSEAVFYGDSTQIAMYRLFRGHDLAYATDVFMKHQETELLGISMSHQVYKLCEKVGKDDECQYSCQCNGDDLCIGIGATKKCTSGCYKCGNKCDADRDCKTTDPKCAGIDSCPNCIENVCVKGNPSPCARKPCKYEDQCKGPGKCSVTNDGSLKCSYSPANEGEVCVDKIAIRSSTCKSGVCVPNLIERTEAHLFQALIGGEGSGSSTECEKEMKFDSADGIFKEDATCTESDDVLESLQDRSNVCDTPSYKKKIDEECIPIHPSRDEVLATDCRYNGKPYDELCRSSGCEVFTSESQPHDENHCYVCDGDATTEENLCFPTRGCNVCGHPCKDDYDCGTSPACGGDVCNHCRARICTRVNEPACDICFKPCDSNNDCQPRDGCNNQQNGRTSECNICSKNKLCVKAEKCSKPCGVKDCESNTDCKESECPEDTYMCKYCLSGKCTRANHYRCETCGKQCSVDDHCGVAHFCYTTSVCTKCIEEAGKGYCRKPKSGGGNSDSFSAESTVQLKNGITRKLSQLRVGDKVQSFDEQSGLELFDEVFYVVHNHPWSGSERVVPLLKLFYGESENSYIALTANHLVYMVPRREDFQVERHCQMFGNFQGCTYLASEVTKGSLLFVANNGTFLPTEVLDIVPSRNQIRGVLTKSGNVIVDGVAASCYIGNHKKKHASLNFFRGLYEWFHLPTLFQKSRVYTFFGILEEWRVQYDVSYKYGAFVFVLVSPIWIALGIVDICVSGLF